MATDQDNVSRIFSILSHPLRREILIYLSEKEEWSFTDLLNVLNVDTGKLSFHIRNLAVFTEQTSTGKYRLSKLGENAVRLIKELEAWSVEAEFNGKTSTFPIAPFKKRVAAFLIDFAIIFGVFLAWSDAFSSLTTGTASFPSANILLFLLFFWVYTTLLEGFGGQTLGKRIVGVKVIRIDGKRLSYEHAAVRNFGKAFLLPFDLAVGIRLKDKRFIRYFDKFSGTTVVDLHPQTMP
jgi:uncharacterized RDD family membrane protein YckC/DNA-binding transcriptional ArsR family regulator